VENAATGALGSRAGCFARPMVFMVRLQNLDNAGEDTSMKPIAVAAAVEVAAGLIFIVSPTLVVRLILNTDLNAAGEAVGRVAGFGLLGLGLACWPGSTRVSGKSAAARGLLAYNLLATVFFIYLGVRGTMVGMLLWPAAVLHAVLAIALARVFLLDFRD
jgi:hypothetical protein